MNAVRGPCPAAGERPEDYGFGNEVMKQTKVCKKCGSVQPADRYLCAACGERLPRENLYQLHKLKNAFCPICDTILTSHMRFCPHCGRKR